MYFSSKSRVYIVIDEQNRIIQIEGEYSLSNIHDLSSATLVEEGEPCDRLNHAQTAYLPKPLWTDDGIPRYRWDGTQAVERTEEELETDRAAIPEPDPTPTMEQRITTLETSKANQTDVDELTEALGLLLSGVTE